MMMMMRLRMIVTMRMIPIRGELVVECYALTTPICGDEEMWGKGSERRGEREREGGREE